MVAFESDAIGPHPSTLEWALEEPITPEHLDAIARVVLNWGKIDVFLGSILAGLYPTKPEHRGLLLNSLETSRKFRLVKKAVSDSVDADLRKYIKEFDFCMEYLKIERDVIAHGTLMHNQSGIGSFTSLKNFFDLPLAKLPFALDNSRYCLEVIICIFRRLTGQQPQTLRDRPQPAHLR